MFAKGIAFGARVGRLAGADWPRQWLGQFHRCPRAAAGVFFRPPAQGDAFSASPSSKLDFRRRADRPKKTLAAGRQRCSGPGRRFRSRRSGAGSGGSIPGANFRARFRRPSPAGDPLHPRPRGLCRRCNRGGIARSGGTASPLAASAEAPRRPATAALVGYGAGAGLAAAAPPAGPGQRCASAVAPYKSRLYPRVQLRVSWSHRTVVHAHDGWHSSRRRTAELWHLR